MSHGIVETFIIADLSFNRETDQNITLEIHYLIFLHIFNYFRTFFFFNVSYSSHLYGVLVQCTLAHWLVRPTLVDVRP